MATSIAPVATTPSTPPSGPAAARTGTSTDVFMQHAAAPSLTSPLLCQLCRQWTVLHHCPDAGEQLRRWAAAHPVLDGHSTPGQVLDLIAGADLGTKDQVLRALLRLAQDGHRLAGEILIQTMLPMLSELPRAIRAPRGEDDYEEVLQRVLAAFWEVIVRRRELPRPRVAGRLRMDTLHQVTRHRRSHDVWEDKVRYFETGSVDALPGPPAQRDGDYPATVRTRPAATGDYSDLDPDGDLATVLLWMRHTGGFSAAEARFLGEVYLRHDGDQKAAAQNMGLSHVATRQRVTRLRRRLCHAVAARPAAMAAAS